MPIEARYNKLDLFKEALAIFGLGDFGSYFDLELPLERKEQFLEDLKGKVKQSYRKLLATSNEVHPDKGGTTEAFLAVQKAFEFVSKFELVKREVVKCPHCHGVGFIQEAIPVSSQWIVRPNFSEEPARTQETSEIRI